MADCGTALWHSALPVFCQHVLLPGSPCLNNQCGISLINLKETTELRCGDCTPESSVTCECSQAIAVHLLTLTCLQASPHSFKIRSLMKLSYQNSPTLAG